MIWHELNINTETLPGWRTWGWPYRICPARPSQWTPPPCKHYCPIRDQYSGHVTSIDQSEASIQVTWPVLTNQSPVFITHLVCFLHLLCLMTGTVTSIRMSAGFPPLDKRRGYHYNPSSDTKVIDHGNKICKTKKGFPTKLFLSPKFLAPQVQFRCESWWFLYK